MSPEGAPAGPAERQAYLTVFGAPPSPVAVTVQAQTLGARAGRAGLALGACWTAAVAAVFIPVAHFILVPALFIAGPVLALLRVRAVRAVTRIHGPCPRCGVEQDFPPGGAWGEPRTVDCPRCKNQLTLTGLGAGVSAGGGRPPAARTDGSA